ncbi:galactokinase [Coccidioides posadasii str. Silveira]|uniref:Galactokinase n=2 Tax=Coccidioides posadasii TaxID=199306 RepID=E9CZ84_COCPS|nr:galactokinase [Coccidioides posadasii str. Silveira]KMM72906.1 galactokinase [Coccidioides posadasii RMSCC 3488]QVM08418.1 galactokinase [Coccidioides posadasii str. Silveira]
MAELVPHTQSIADIYPSDVAGDRKVAPDQQARWISLIKAFRHLYAQSPDFVARSPGRVNIIGEHIDYSLYDVLPTALRVDVLIAIKAVQTNGQDGFVQLSNVYDAKFPATEFQIPHDRDVEIDASKNDWANYFKAGLLVAIKFLRKKSNRSSFVPSSIKALVDGNVPPGGGLSSSAAFVCASALAVVKAHGCDISKQELLDISLVSERFVGVYSGGMDQAASIFSRHGYLLYVRFFPRFHTQYVPIPKTEPELTFLVAQTFITSNKAETAPKHYNLRVAECTLGALVLAKLHGIELPKDSSSLGYSFRTYHHELMQKEGRLEDPLEYQLDSIILGVTELLTQEQGYTREEIAKILGLTVPELESKFLSAFPVQADRFLLRQRALHCFKEARRVLDFKACLSRSNHLDEHGVRYLGQLMNESQESCRTLYDCSCPEVNSICEIALQAGSFGSRLTGAGWGGCTVHMIPQSKVEAVTSALKREYYSKRFPELNEEELKHAMVISKPSNGSFVISGAAITDVEYENGV